MVAVYLITAVNDVLQEYRNMNELNKICWFCKKNRHADCMKKIPIDSKSAGPHDCTFDMTSVMCSCKH